MQTELQLQASDIPTLTDLEAAFRRVKDHKAVGEDQIPPELCHHFPTSLARLAFGQLLKLCSHGQEALLHKGGVLVAAWKKKGPQILCESYRSLLISSHIAKSVHRAVRDHQSTVYEAFLQSAQIGGRKSIPVSLGVHYIRAAARRARNLGRSHALVFLDLREAFYRVLRPISIGGHIPDSLLATVAARLHLPDDALADLQALLQLPSGTSLAGLPRHMRRALQALHTNTHFRMEGQEDRVHTLIGSRPGDPFADVVFGYMFSRILTTVETRLAELGILETFIDVEQHGLFVHDNTADMKEHTLLGPTWMDDLCLTISHPTATGVESQAGVAASVLLETCTAHGVTPNLDKGKSEILFTFRGAGSRKLRIKYFSAQCGQKMPITHEYGTQQISVVGQYTHLGSIAHHTGLTHREIRRRIAIGNGAFAAHRRILFQNPAFSKQRRAELFQSLVTSKIAYSMESWTFSDHKTFDYFWAALLRLYRRLLKLQPDTIMHDEEVLMNTKLPAPDDMLRIARLRYIGLLYKCENVTPWAIFRADHTWLSLVKDDFQWLWGLIADTCRLRDPAQHFEDWEYVLRYHRSYWKTLLQRGALLRRMKRDDDLQLRHLHQDVLSHLSQHGQLQTAPVRAHLDLQQQQMHFGCMHCAKRCRTKAGEGAHLFKVHGVIALERQWIAGTTCEACLCEFHSHDKLQNHLRTAQRCREALSARPMYPTPVPGKGSLLNNELRERHDGLLPVQRAHGPQREGVPPRQVDLHHQALFEALVLQIYETEETDLIKLFAATQNTIQAHYIGWSQTRLTLNEVARSFDEEAIMDTHLTRAQIQRLLADLSDATNWAFLQEVESEAADPSHLYPLALYEQWCNDLAGLESAWSPSTPTCPRIFYRERVLLHAYSGRRRPGDFQWFVDKLALANGMEGIMVVSVDLVIDTTWGDISRAATQQYWLNAMSDGYVVGMLSGPPCCTWSIARGKAVPTTTTKGPRGPRVIRTRQHLWGLASVSIREMTQLHDGHVLLGFSLQGMVRLSTSGGIGVLEHPGEPEQVDAASIWRLPLMQLILNLPGFQLRECAQGLLGAASTKRTGLLTLNLPDLPQHIRANLIRPDLPRAATIGVDAEGRFRTAVLKEYPPAFCRGLAQSFLSHLPSVDHLMDLGQIPAIFLERCRSMTSTDMGHAIGADCAR